jgi:hypothetical protein
MRQTMTGLAAAIAVVAASAAPAMACGCSPCGQPYVTPCGQTYPGFTTFERLPDPELQYGSPPTALPQYYYADQGPTYTGPGNFAPYPTYREGGIYAGYYHHHHHHHHYGYREPVLRRAY